MTILARIYVCFGLMFVAGVCSTLLVQNVAKYLKSKFFIGRYV